ncbi:MAG: DUF86 domain-containing protein [Actinomycetota bacterium]|nr:DUF86 domain-containing protein [Actinomycetota bacterium]
MQPRDERLWLEDIQDALRRIAEYTASGRTQFFESEATQDAVIRNLEVLGEAARHILVRLLEAAPEVPWQLVIGMRDRLIHGYFILDLEIVWETIERDLPGLRAAVDRLLAET